MKKELNDYQKKGIVATLKGLGTIVLAFCMLGITPENPGIVLYILGLVTAVQFCFTAMESGTGMLGGLLLILVLAIGGGLFRILGFIIGILATLFIVSSELPYAYGFLKGAFRRKGNTRNKIIGICKVVFALSFLVCFFAFVFSLLSSFTIFEWCTSAFATGWLTATCVSFFFGGIACGVEAYERFQ